MSKPKPVKQIDIKTNKVIKVWNSASEAQRQGGFNYSRIVLTCQGKARSSNGYKWEYADEKLAKKYTPKPKQKKTVVYYDFSSDKEQVFSSTKEAAKAFNTTPNLIRVIANATNQFLKGNRGIPKYFLTGTFFYNIDTGSNKNTLLQKVTQLDYDCKICNLRFSTAKALATHLQMLHDISTEEYTLVYLFNKKPPTCLIENCSNKTAYVSFGYKQYCKEHASEAMKAGGQIGGRATAWNKGKTKYDDSRIMKQAIEMKGHKNPFWGKQHSEESIAKISNQKRLSEEQILERLQNRESDFIFPDFDYTQYYSRQHQKIKAVCVKCKKSMKKTLQSLERGTLCKFCHPFTVSKGELEMANFIAAHTNKRILQNDRTAIAPYELDIFIPELKLAFEYHGLYWHMDKGEKGFNKNLHYEKMLRCNEKGIALVQFFSSQWEEHRNIVESMILNKLGVNKEKIGARETEVCTLNPQEAEQFFNQNHLHGHTKHKKCFALRSKKTNEVVLAVAVRKAFHRKYNSCLEIARFAPKLNTTIVGGFGKLLKRIKSYAIEENYSAIITYADLMHGTGDVYLKTGFEYIGHTGLNYWYTDGKKLYNRFMFRAKKPLSEKQIAKNNNVYRIYGSGNALYRINLQ